MAIPWREGWKKLKYREARATRQKDPPSLLARQFSSMQDAMKAQYIYIYILVYM